MNPSERRYDQLLHAVVAAIERQGYAPIARRSTATTSCVLLHGAAGVGRAQPGRFLVVVHLPGDRCLRVRRYPSEAALHTGPPERELDYYYQATRPTDLRRIVRALIASIVLPA